MKRLSGHLFSVLVDGHSMGLRTVDEAVLQRERHYDAHYYIPQAGRILSWLQREAAALGWQTSILDACGYSGSLLIHEVVAHNGKKMVRLRYHGVRRRLKDLTALAIPDMKRPGYWEVQFDRLNVPEAYGWHSFHYSDFEPPAGQPDQ